MNRALYMSVIAFAAAAAVNANTTARAEERGHAELMDLIGEDIDAENNEFTLALIDRAGARAARRMETRTSIFGPLVASSDAAAEAAAGTGANLAAIVVARAEFEIGKDAANIEDPFNPRLPMAPAIVAFVSEDY